MKYLGIEIDNKRNYFKTQRQNYTKSTENGKHNIQCDREELQQIIDRKDLLEKYCFAFNSLWYQYNKFNRG